MASLQFFAVPVNKEQTRFEAWAVTETLRGWHHTAIFDNPLAALDASGTVGVDWLEVPVPPMVQALARSAFARDLTLENNRAQARVEQ
jgi:hypothetical protein